MAGHEANSYQVSRMPNTPPPHTHISLQGRYPCQPRAEHKRISAAPPKTRVIDSLPEPHYLSLEHGRVLNHYSSTSSIPSLSLLRASPQPWAVEYVLL